MMKKTMMAGIPRYSVPAATLAAICLLCACRLIFPAKSGWEYAGGRRFSAKGTGESAFLYADAQSRPCVVYTELPAYPGTMKGKAYGGGAWGPIAGASDVISDKGSGFFGGSFLSALDSTGNPVVAYSSMVDTGLSLVVSALSGGSWATLLSEPLIENPTSGMTINHYPKCLFSTPSAEVGIGILDEESSGGTQSYTLRFSVISTGALQSAGLPDLAVPGAYGSYSLGYASDGTAYLSCCEEDASYVRSTRVLKSGGAAWTDSGSNSPPIAYAAKILFDSQGSPQLAFMEITTVRLDATSTKSFYTPRLYSLSGGAWADSCATPLSIYSESSGFGTAVLADGSVAFGFEDSTTVTGEVSVIKFSGNAWEFLGSQEFTDGNCGEFPSLAAAADGNLYLSFSEVGHDSKLSVMRYVGF